MMRTVLMFLAASFIPLGMVRADDDAVVSVVYDDDADCAIDCHWYCYTCSELATNNCPIMACTEAQRQCLWDYWVSTQHTLGCFSV